MNSTIPLNDITGKCPYCHSPYVVSGSYIYHSDGTRIPAFKCKDCNHSFSFGTYLKEETKIKSADMRLQDMVSYGLIEETKPDLFRITNLGHNVIKQHKQTSSTSLEDNILLEFPLWKDMFKTLPLHPSYEMFIKTLKTIYSDDPPIMSECNRLWHKYTTEVEPARERARNKKGMVGFAGVTLLPYEKGVE